MLAESKSADKYKSIRKLTVKDTQKAAKTLLEAFRDDALAKLLVSHLPNETIRDYCELKLYEAYVNQHILTGLVLGINENAENFDTVAIWALPDSIDKGLESFSTLMRSGYDQVWSTIGEEGRSKVFDGMLPLLHDSCEKVMTTDSRFIGKNVYTLVYLGSTLNARGKGYVTLMFDYMFNNFIDKDSDNIAYLESSSATNIPIYERYGFYFYKDIMLGTKGPDSIEGKHYAMMNIMIRGAQCNDWRKEKNTYISSKL